MSIKRNRRQKQAELQELCAQPGEDDGIDPKHAVRREPDRGGSIDRKTRQLCGQVACAVDFVLAAQTYDDELSGLMVASVVPAAHRGHLIVTVMPGPIGPTQSGEIILPKLRNLSRQIRSEVSQSITRRKVPELSFAYIPSQVTGDEDA